jgi:hypothetical protein
MHRSDGKTSHACAEASAGRPSDRAISFIVKYIQELIPTLLRETAKAESTSYYLALGP